MPGMPYRERHCKGPTGRARLRTGWERTGWFSRKPVVIVEIEWAYEEKPTDRKYTVWRDLEVDDAMLFRVRCTVEE